VISREHILWQAAMGSKSIQIEANIYLRSIKKEIYENAGKSETLKWLAFPSIHTACRNAA
jgi:hypothetical protein